MGDTALDHVSRPICMQFSCSMNPNHHPAVAVLLDRSKRKERRNRPQDKIEIQTRRTSRGDQKLKGILAENNIMCSLDLCTSISVPDGDY